MKTRKLAAILIALAIALSFGVSALAADPPQIKVNNVGDITILDVYQILTYDFDDDNGNYSNVTFGTGYATVFANVLGGFGYTGTNVNKYSTDAAQDMLLYITNDIMKGTTYNKDDFARALANALEAYVNNNSVTASFSKSASQTATNGSYTFSPVPIGYYLVIDRTGTDESYNALAMLWPMAPNATIDLKSQSNPPPVKEAEVTGGTIFTGEGTSVNIGATVEFTITLTIPNFSTYEQFAYVAYDIMDTGYTFNDDATYTLGGVTYTGPTPVIVTDATARATFTDDSGISLTDKQLIKFDFGTVNTVFKNYIGKELVITYTATVNNTALGEVVDNTPVILQNDKYDTGDGTSHPIYGFDFTKYDADTEEGLAGVTFKLYAASVGEDGLQYDENAPLKFTVTNGVYLYDASGGTATITSLTDGVVNIHGLQAGTYALVEVNPLPGYNPLTGPVKIVLPETENLSVGDIANVAGIELPSTGGMGTVLFTVIGLAIIVGAGVVLFINRKRVFGK